MRNEYLEGAIVEICEAHGRDLTGGARHMLEVAGENVRSAIEMIEAGRMSVAAKRMRVANSALSGNPELARASIAMRRAISVGV